MTFRSLTGSWSHLPTGGTKRKLELAVTGARSTSPSMIGGMSMPLSLFIAGRRLCMWIDSLYFRAQYLVSLSMTLTLSSEQVCPVSLYMVSYTRTVFPICMLFKSDPDCSAGFTHIFHVTIITFHAVHRIAFAVRLRFVFGMYKQ